MLISRLSSVMKHHHSWQPYTIVRYHYPKGIIISRRRGFGSNQMELEEAHIVHIESLFRISFCVLSGRSLALFVLYLYVAYTATLKC